ncbi:MAG: zf-HC2 domain-containing protein [Gammaproteobacteria bacterium]|nr:zf-HC2 domain-containing protein [Gammaproteobacteria bacterium]
MHQLSCDDIQSSLIDYLEFELPILLRQQFNEHLTLCDQCREQHDDLQNVIIDTKSLGTEEPDQQFWQELPNKILHEVKSHEHQTSHATADSTIASIADDATGNIFSDAFSNRLQSKSNVLPFTALAKKAQLSSTEDNRIGIQPKPKHPQILQRQTPETPETQQLNEKPYSKLSWPKIILPMAASAMLAVCSVLFVNQSNIHQSDHVRISNDTPMHYDSVAAQLRISTDAALTDKALANLAQAMIPINHQSPRFGFTSQNAILNSFSIGALFSETIVYIKSNDKTLVKTHLALLSSVLSQQADSKQLVQKIQLLQTQIQSGSSPAVNADALNKIMNRYASSLKSVVNNSLKSAADKELVLFKAGAWSYDLALAALAKVALLSSQVDEINIFKNQLQHLGAPAGVSKSLEEINDLAMKKVMSDEDYKKIVQEIENIRSLAG